MATTSTTTKSSTAEKLASSSNSNESSLTSSIQTSSISSTVQASSTGTIIPFEAQIMKPNPETTTGTYLSNSTTPEDQTSTEMMAAGNTPADPSLTINIDESISATVQPTSTGFTMYFEPPPTAVEPAKDSSASLSTSIAAEESSTSETIAVPSTPAYSLSWNTTETVITSATIQPSCTRSLEPSAPPPPSPLTPSQTNIVDPNNTPSKSSTLSITANEPTKRDTMTSRTVIIHGSTQATTSYEASRTESSLMGSLISRPRDWGFNVFLDALATEITNEELRRLKLYFIGENGIGYGTLEKIETPLEFFTTLRRRNILTRDNMIYLQAMLWHLKRQDLHKKCVEHARNFGNVTYFYAPSPEPENGYRYVKFHVESNESIDFDRRKLEYIRTAVAELLLVPPEFVLVSGLEPSSSLIITFMVPEYYASLLIEMVVDYCTPQLLDVGIDKIYYDGKLYPLLGKASNDNILGNFRGKLEDRDELLERLQRTETWLEQREKEVLELSRLLNKAEKGLQKVSEGDAEHKCIEIPTFQTQTDFPSQISSMQKSKESGPCTEYVSVRRRSLIRSEARGECTHDIRKPEINPDELQVGLTRRKCGHLISKSVPGGQVKIGIVLSRRHLQIMQSFTLFVFFSYIILRGFLLFSHKNYNDAKTSSLESPCTYIHKRLIMNIQFPGDCV